MSCRTGRMDTNSNVSKCNLLTIRNLYHFLQTCPNLNMISRKPFHSRLNKQSFKASFFAPFGSLTVEAALVIPIFLFAVLSLLGMMEIYEVQMRLEAALHQTAKEMAVQGYAYDRLSGETNAASAFPVTVVFSETYVRAKVQDYVTASYLDHSVIEHGRRGMLYSFSKIMESDRIELRVVYRVAPRLSVIPFWKAWTISQAVVRAFTGYDPAKPWQGQDEDGAKQYVYVTQCGSAYHSDRGCSHLKLSIQLVEAEKVPNMRNDGGGRYRPCQICHGLRGTQGVVLITNLGDRYHKTAACPGLKRTIEQIPLSEAAGYHPCHRCVVGG